MAKVFAGALGESVGILQGRASVKAEGDVVLADDEIAEWAVQLESRDAPRIHGLFRPGDGLLDKGFQPSDYVLESCVLVRDARHCTDRDGKRMGPAVYLDEFEFRSMAARTFIFSAIHS